jgi:hypothetical protein
MSEKKDFDLPLGNFFGPTKRGLSFVCGIMVVAGVLLGLYIVSFLFFILIFILVFSRRGIVIDIQKREYCIYIAIFSLRTYGKPRSVDEYSFVSVLKSNLVYTAYSRTNRSAVTGVEKTYNIVLLGKHQIMKLVLGKYNTKEEALEKANQLSNALNLPTK